MGVNAAILTSQSLKMLPFFRFFQSHAIGGIKVCAEGVCVCGCVCQPLPLSTGS